MSIFSSQLAFLSRIPLVTYLIPVGFVALAVGEFAIDKWRGSSRKSAGLIANTTTYVIVHGLFLLVVLRAEISFLSSFRPLTSFHFSDELLSFALCLLLIDFTFYWLHRLEHHMPLLWTAHGIHHSTDEFNYSVALRLPWIGLIEWTAYSPLASVGFSLNVLLLCMGLHNLYMNMLHNRWIGKLGPLESVFCTPSNHRVHHGKDEPYLNRNFGGILIIWDKLFGTYQKELSPIVYGTVEPRISNRIVEMNFQPLVQLMRASIQSRGLVKKVRVLLLP